MFDGFDFGMVHSIGKSGSNSDKGISFMTSAGCFEFILIQMAHPHAMVMVVVRPSVMARMMRFLGRGFIVVLLGIVYEFVWVGLA